MTDHERMRRYFNAKRVMMLNYSDLEEFHRTYEAPEYLLRITSNDATVQRFYCDSLRFVMNYMSAWYALKSFIQAQMKNTHFSVTANFKEKYSEQISERFARNDFTRFFEACRNTFIHEGIPFAKMQISIGQVDTVRIMVDSDELRRSSYFESKGLPYIDGRQSIDFFRFAKGTTESSWTFAIGLKKTSNGKELHKRFDGDSLYGLLLFIDQMPYADKVYIVCGIA